MARRIRWFSDQEHLAACLRAKGARGIGIRKLRELRLQLRFASFKAGPPIPVKVKNHGAGAQDLPDALGLLPGNAEHHVEQFVQTKSLANNRAETDVASLFFGVTNR